MCTLWRGVCTGECVWQVVHVCTHAGGQRQLPHHRLTTALLGSQGLSCPVLPRSSTPASSPSTRFSTLRHKLAKRSEKASPHPKTPPYLLSLCVKFSKAFELQPCSRTRAVPSGRQAPQGSKDITIHCSSFSTCLTGIKSHPVKDRLQQFSNALT